MSEQWIWGLVFVGLVAVLSAGAISRRFRRTPLWRVIAGVVRILAGLGAVLEAFSND